MSHAARDIRRTLLIKLLLLILLWLVCFRGTEKPVVNGPSWLLGTNISTPKQGNTP
jgi:hypothetical protein